METAPKVAAYGAYAEVVNHYFHTNVIVPS